jgi:hypothetical protein
MLRADPQTIVSRPTILSMREEVILYLHLVTSHVIDKAYCDIGVVGLTSEAMVAEPARVQQSAKSMRGS